MEWSHATGPVVTILYSISLDTRPISSYVLTNKKSLTEGHANQVSCGIEQSWPGWVEVFRYEHCTRIHCVRIVPWIREEF